MTDKQFLSVKLNVFWEPHDKVWRTGSSETGITAEAKTIDLLLDNLKTKISEKINLKQLYCSEADVLIQLNCCRDEHLTVKR